jgi:hypothetical protein
MLPRDPILKYERRRQQAEREEGRRRDRRDRRRAKDYGMPSPGALIYVPARQVEGQPWREGRTIRNGR